MEQPKGLSLQDVDIIKHTAQFVAKNGKNFLVALTEREKQNPQFDFLMPTHDWFSYFLKLVDAYQQCITIKQKEIDKISQNLKDKGYILNQCSEKFEYEKQMQERKKKKKEDQEEEFNYVSQIDWNDFVIVETINFQEAEEAAPTKPTQPVLSGVSAQSNQPPAQQQPPAQTQN